MNTTEGRTKELPEVTKVYFFKKKGVAKMKFPPKKIIENLKRDYPKGARVKLVMMDDIQAPPTGTLGTVLGVDDAGSIMVAWDNGSRLSVAFGPDYCEVVD